MAEQTRTMAEASCNLAALSQRTVHDTIILVNDGTPESVLMSYEVYGQLSVLADFLEHPDRLLALQEGIREAEAGDTISGDELVAQMRAHANLRKPIERDALPDRLTIRVEYNDGVGAGVISAEDLPGQ